MTDTKKMDWHLLWAAAGIVITLSAVIIGCYVSLNTRLTKIETVLILRNIMPIEMIGAKDHEK